MKTCVNPYLLLTVAGLATTHFGFAQHRSSVGVNIIMQPIQTIRIETNTREAIGLEESASEGKGAVDRQKVTAFGTAAYQVTIDREETPGRFHVQAKVEELMEQVGVDSFMDVSPEREPTGDHPRRRPLVFYSIRVN